MLRWIVTFIFISTGLIALEANMFQQQTWDVQEMTDANKAKFTATPTVTPGAKPTATITQTPNPSSFTPTPTPTPSH